MAGSLVFLEGGEYLFQSLHDQSNVVYNYVGNCILPCSMLVLGLALKFSSEMDNRFFCKVKGPV